MLNILPLRGVIFILIAVGFGMVASGAFDQNHMEAPSHYVMMLALPKLNFRAVATKKPTVVLDSFIMSGGSGPEHRQR